MSNAFQSNYLNSEQKSKNLHHGVIHSITAPYIEPGDRIQYHVLETLSQGNTCLTVVILFSAVTSMKKHSRIGAALNAVFTQPGPAQQVTSILYGFTVLPSPINLLYR